MADEQLSSFCSKLSINEGEQSKVVITQEWLEEGDEGALVFFLIRKLFSKRPANVEGMRTALFNAWGLESGLVIKEVAEKVYLFNSEEESDRDRVLVRIYELLPIMMTEKIGAAVAGKAGKVMEIDHQWGKFLRENDCQLAVDMRTKQGFVTRRFSPNIRARSPRPKSNRFDVAESSFKSGGSSSRRSSPLSVTSGTRGARGGGGGSAQLSFSAINSRGHVRRHVDSMLLRGRPVARAIFPEETSCKILSRNPGVVPPNMGGGNSVNGGPRVVGGSTGVVARSEAEGSWFEEEIRELYGDLGLPNSMGMVNPNGEVQGSVGVFKGKGKQIQAELQGDSSTDSSAPLINGVTRGQQQTLHYGVLGGQPFGESVSTPSIPGLSGRGVINGHVEGAIRSDLRGCDPGTLRASLGPDLMGLLSNLVAGLNQKSSTNGQGESSRPKQTRRWKKHARVSDRYTFDAMTRHIVSKVGNKRLPGFTICDVDHGTAAKRSREEEPGLDDHGAAANNPRRQDNDPGVDPQVPAGADNDDVGEARTTLDRRAGGLALLWQDPSLINIVSFSSSHIDANNNLHYHGCVWVTYEILTNDEKIGGPPRSQRQMEMFRATVEFCEFRDLPIKGPLMTWSRRMQGDVVFERLDKCFVMEEWLNLFQFSFVHVLMSSEFDHLPLHIEVLDKPWVGIHYNHRFRFERMWLTHDGVQTVINDSWNVRQEMSIQQGIASCAQSLQHWDKTVFGNVRYSIRKKKRDLERYYKEAQKDGLSGNLNDCLNDLYELYDREESMWRQRSKLVREFTMEEIRVAAFDMGADKSPGPDGMPPLFYQKYWHVVGAKVSEMALAFLNSGVSLPDVNQTVVIVSKTLANRLREVLPFIIGPNQSAFVLGKMIFDSSIIAFESIHYMKNKRSGGEKHMVLKLDLSKAYDRVEWVFLERIMARLGFSNRWVFVFLVMECVRTVMYSILVNDDSLLFLRASLEECDVVLDLLRQFELASGQQVNIDKSAVMFSGNTPVDLREIIMRHLRIQKVLDQDRYLGLPIMIGRSKRVELHLIKDRLWKRLRSWSGKLLSIAERRFIGRLEILYALQSWMEVWDSGILNLSIWLYLRSSIGVLFRMVIRFVVRWRIGNGQTVDIWRDRWLAKPPSYQPAPRPGTVLQNNLVSSLFNNDGYWDDDLLSKLFEDEDVYRILCIPLHLSSADRLIWNHSVDGHYTIRSGYHVARRILGKEVAEVGARSVMWRLIWGANVVPKVKFFMWRLIHGILPTKSQLQSRGIPIDQSCLVCGGVEYNLYHVFFDCVFSKTVWDIISPWLPVSIVNWVDREDFWDCLLSKASQLGSLDVVCMVLWMIWSNRNKALYEQVCKLPQSLCLAVNRFMFDFDASNRRAIGRPIQEQRVWQPPATGLVKINADATFYQADGVAVLGAVIRDHTGRVLLSEALCEGKRKMAHATRGKKLVAEIKRSAKTGNEAITKTLAQQLVRLRQQIAKLQSSRAQMRGIESHTQAMHAQSYVDVGIKGATKAMSAMNKQMASAKQAKVRKEIQKQLAQMDMTTEMMSDAINGALDDDKAKDETEDLTNQVLDQMVSMLPHSCHQLIKVGLLERMLKVLVGTLFFSPIVLYWETFTVEWNQCIREG
ncbi:reverse transcriptase [Corchorus capsularis]|uniref:Reverse transcriptase n=1 Tax=Corchorus capsularis TaxID=210143 RepID=A0A1R3IDQ1_COCAP|nr:reverse transcriptase [Corchorus capsularis]